MTAFRVLAARVRALLRTGRSDADLEDDIRAHLDLLTEEHVRRGLSVEEARTAAHRAFGGVEQMKEAYRDQRGLPVLETLARDLAYGVRMLRRQPSLTAVAVLSLGLGIGSSTAAFSLFNMVLLRPLPVPSADDLVLLQPQRRGDRFILFNPVLEELRARQHTLSQLTAISDQPFQKVTFDDDEAPTYVAGSLVSGNYFEMLGLRPAIGRLLTPQDDARPDDPRPDTATSDASTREAAAKDAASAPDANLHDARTNDPRAAAVALAPVQAARAAAALPRPGAQAVAVSEERCAAVISHAFWRRRFAQRSEAIGRTLRVRDRVCTIVGVAPATFTGHLLGSTPDIWLPLRPLTDRTLLDSVNMAFFSGVMGRLAAGVRIDRAEAELTMLFQQAQAAQLSSTPQDANRPRLGPADFRMRVTPGAQGLDTMRRMFGQPLAIVLAVVALVLLIATANVANLLIARGAARLPELSTRAALGASRGRLVRQLATEGGLLAALGGLLGVALAGLGTPALARLIAPGLDATADGRVLAVAMGTTLLAALLAGVLPALRLSDATLQAGIARDERTTLGHGQRLTRTLVAAQLALSLVLVTTAGLLLRTIVELSGLDPGFAPDHVALLQVRDETPGPAFGALDPQDERARRAARYRALDERLNALPGVHAASVSWLGLFSESDLWLPLIDADRPDDRPMGRVDYVSARYFETMGMRLLRGRGFTAHDRDGAPRVAVVNETLARSRFGSLDPLGRRLSLDHADERDRPFTIVGLVRDSKYNHLREASTGPMMWVPITQAPFRLSSIALRTEPGAEAAVAREAARLLAATEPAVRVRTTTTLAEHVARSMRRERLLLGLSSGFGAMAVLLAAVGLYGTLAYAVSRRTREIGVRLAFGAPRGAVLRMVLREALMLVAVAAAIGLPLALLAGRSLRAFLFGVTPVDPVTLAGACLLLTLAALLAAWIPARRAASVDPMVALRLE